MCGTSLSREQKSLDMESIWLSFCSLTNKPLETSEFLQNFGRFILQIRGMKDEG